MRRSQCAQNNAVHLLTFVLLLACVCQAAATSTKRLIGRLNPGQLMVEERTVRWLAVRKPVRLQSVRVAFGAEKRLAKGRLIFTNPYGLRSVVISGCPCSLCRWSATAPWTTGIASYTSAPESTGRWMSCSAGGCSTASGSKSSGSVFSSSSARRRAASCLG